MSDKREHPRYAIELDASVVAADGRVTGRTDNLSRGGFCMIASGELAVGSPCHAVFALVFSENQFSEHLTLSATVVWCTHTREGVQLGIKFAPLDAQAKGYLDLFMQFLEGGEDDEEPHDG